MKHDDYFHKNLRQVHTVIYDIGVVQKLHAGITSFFCSSYTPDIIFPKSLTRLSININNIEHATADFYKNLPPGLLTLWMPTNSAISYPSLLPRSLTKLLTCDDYNLRLLLDSDVDFPPNIVEIGGIVLDEHQSGTLDFSKLTRLCKLKVNTELVVDKSFRMLLPPNLTSFVGDMSMSIITSNIKEIVDTNHITSADFINSLPNSVTNIDLYQIDDSSHVTFPPNLRYLSISEMQLSISGLDKLPRTLEYYKQSSNRQVKLVRAIDGNKFVAEDHGMI